MKFLEGLVVVGFCQVFLGFFGFFWVFFLRCVAEGRISVIYLFGI